MSRRDLVRSGALSLALIACGRGHHDEEEGEDVSPGEDLMREHGVLSRVMTIYEAAAQRLDAGDRGVLDTVRAAARIAREFVEDYHERMEEQYVFPRLEHANRLPDLVAVLRRQHDAGRGLTDRILTLGKGTAAAMRGYIKMFQPHVAREDTLVFPALHEIAGKSYDELGEQMEAEEHRQFGKGGFERFVAALPALETAVGVADLSRFTVTPDSLE